MRERFKVNTCKLLKAVVCLAFFGILTANSRAGLLFPPNIVVQPLGLAVQKGGTAILTSTATSLTAMKITWFFNGEPIHDPQVLNVVVPLVGTVSTLTVPHVSSHDQGAYSMQVTNAGGMVTSHDAVLIILGDVIITPVTILTSQCGMTNGGFRLNLLKPATSNCVLEASTDFRNWTPIHTNSASSTNFSYLDAAATNLTFRYYRARLQ
jgi:hypothetical protein